MRLICRHKNQLPLNNAVRAAGDGDFHILWLHQFSTRRGPFSYSFFAWRIHRHIPSGCQCMVVFAYQCAFQRRKVPEKKSSRSIDVVRVKSAPRGVQFSFTRRSQHSSHPSIPSPSQPKNPNSAGITTVWPLRQFPRLKHKRHTER